MVSSTENTVNVEQVGSVHDNIQEVIEAKKHAEKILSLLVNVGKKVKQTKQSRKVIKALKEFIRCNITNPVIFEKYGKVVSILQEYAHGKDND